MLALGSYSTQMLAPLGVRIPVYPVKGYSITVPITDASMAPESTIMDETHKVAVTRLGDRIRVGGTAELSGFDLGLDPARRRTLEFVVSDLFPHGGDVARAEFWAGLRPMTPDGTPIVGAHGDRQPLPEHRPRHAGLDHGCRHRPLDGRPRLGPRTRDRTRRPDAGALQPPAQHRHRILDARCPRMKVEAIARLA